MHDSCNFYMHIKACKEKNINPIKYCLFKLLLCSQSTIYSLDITAYSVWRNSWRLEAICTLYSSKKVRKLCLLSFKDTLRRVEMGISSNWSIVNCKTS